MPLEPPDQQHWQAAVGYVELGMFQDANDQLEKIDPFTHIATTDRRFVVHAEEKLTAFVELESGICPSRRIGLTDKRDFFKTHCCKKDLNPGVG